MPFLKMKSKDSLREREKRVLGVSKKPSKSLCSETKVSDRMEQHLITATHNCHKNEQENKGKALFLELYICRYAFLSSSQ